MKILAKIINAQISNTQNVKKKIEKSVLVSHITNLLVLLQDVALNQMESQQKYMDLVFKDNVLVIQRKFKNQVYKLTNAYMLLNIILKTIQKDFRIINNFNKNSKKNLKRTRMNILMSFIKK
ncbi:hypothetical protein TTHERM_001499914 (macronuclear) [Tetrahymena thermophila SB210]|uniref:Uncharacterized protein n=1 Tax=Tetrahymena thermophila (strain SB210) TaxID=312017 RepID=W7XCI5_TETTS|nr:hypothetical protein TTHERM_001499914 [Tetrahymena thermophila SB210]EWS75172.1 hypothetical protein TTHERM_001499914 [Tetrahymena thermophila SB210]|eukprot:XP_012652293.1 hypothetical protein TTHERM_001499914 [Tetrahymena thermophila SB210]